MSLRGAAAIVGIGELPPVRETHGETTLATLARVARAAIEDAALEPTAVDGLIVGPQVGEIPQHVPATVAEYLGLRPRFADLVDLGGATAAGMVWRAACAIKAGMCETVLCVLGNIREPGNEPRSPTRAPIREFDVPFGASGANTSYALIAQAHMRFFGTRPEQLARVAVAQRENAQHNPAAIFYGQPITVDDVLSSPVIAHPLRLLEVVMPCAGGAALVVAPARRARSFPHPPVLLRGAGEKVTHRALSQAPSLVVSPIKAAITDAYSMAGVDPGDIDVLSLYDCYTIIVAITLEDGGFCAKGRSGPWIEEHDLTFRGDFPLNTHGGQLSFGQADLAGGMSHVTEAVRQLRGEAGARQVRDARLALVTGNGATMSEGSALVLEAA